MARLRTIKPGFFTNDDLGECSPYARLLFAGLWTIADREGRLLDRPKKIKAEALPYDDEDADALLAVLAERGFILRYEAEGQRCIQIVNWHKHQTPHIKEAPSTIPAPCKNSAPPAPEPGEHPPKPALAPPVLGTSSGNRDLGSGEWAPDAPSEHPRQETAPKEDKPKRAVARRVPDPPDDEFESWWARYPRREDKHAAKEAYRKRRKAGRSAEALLAAAGHYADRADQEGTEIRFIKRAAGWLNLRCDEDWENGPPVPATLPKRPQGGSGSVLSRNLAKLGLTPPSRAS